MDPLSVINAVLLMFVCYYKLKSWRFRQIANSNSCGFCSLFSACLHKCVHYREQELFLQFSCKNKTKSEKNMSSLLLFAIPANLRG